MTLHDEAAPAPLRVEHLSLAYNHRAVLSDLSWRISPGQVVGLLGRNGAGKTTLLETVLGLRQPDAGSTWLFEQPSLHPDDATRARIGYVPQQSNLFEWMTPDQLLGYFRAFYPRWNDAKVEGLLTRWAIDRQQPIGRLSVGQQQRLSIIRALAHEPELLVLDEPVASLDPVGRRDFLQELVEQVSERDTSIVFSTHILTDLERVAVDVAFLTHGQLTVQMPLDTLLEDARRVRGPRSVLSGWLETHHLPVWTPTSLNNDQLQVLTCVPPQLAATLPGGLTAESVNLEDLFTEFTA